MAKQLDYTPAGLVRQKNGRLKYPFKKTHFQDDSVYMQENLYGQALVDVGDIVSTSFNLGLSDNSVGKVVAVKLDQHWASILTDTRPTERSVMVEMMNGTIEPQRHIWCGILDESQVAEIKQFYISQGKQDKIKVSW